MINVLQISKAVTRLFSDESLTRKAVLNALSSSLDYFTQLAVAFIITPFMVAGLGDYFYGAWQTLNRMVGYLSPAVGKPTQTLRWTLANQQASVDFDMKRRYVGSAVAVWLFFLPLLGILGVLLSWFIPYWLQTPASHVWQIRLTTFLLVTNLVMLSFSSLPQSVLQGENLGYKRIGLASLLTIMGGIFTWLVLYFQKGVVGVAAVAFLISGLSGFLYIMVARSNVVWFGIKRPTYNEIRNFFGLSVWFIAWDLIMKLMMISDVVILAFLNSVESVTSYSLTKQAPETIISMVAIMVFGIVPGLGGIIGSGQIKKAAQLRGEIMAMTWLMLTVLGAVILFWNRIFIHLWVGDKQYAGTLANLLMILVVYQFSLIKNDASMIDLTLKIQYKVSIGALSVIIAIVSSGIFVSYFQLGIVGLCMGLILGRMILSIAYPALIGRYLDVSFSSQIKSSIRPGLVTLFLFGFAFILSSFELERYFSGLRGWLLFSSMGVLTAGFLLFFSFYSGLTKRQRQKIWKRFKHLTSQS